VDPRILARHKCDPEALVDALRRFRGKRILVVGDVMLDRFIWGAVSRISPEAPVPVVEIRKESVHLGGAANVAANVRSLGGIPIPLGIVGEDPEGRLLRDEFRALGAPIGGVVVDYERATSVKTRIIAHHQQVCRTDREDRHPVRAEIHRRLVRCFHESVRASDAVIVSDYAKSLVSPALLRDILPVARSERKLVCVDPKLTNFSVYRPATVITPNSAETEQASGIAIHSNRDLLRAGRKILRQTGIRYLLVTRGEHGMALFEGDGPVRHIPTVAREVFDVTGAGDTVVGTLALGLVAGLPMLQSAMLANIAAGIVVGKLGTASVTPDELIARIRE
jgi:D-beta-D-heptose 7-phosphate kinase/D-beta-D-heptose 1-phosphate adenosyltransferase